MQECLREERRIEQVTGQVEDAQWYTVDVRCGVGRDCWNVSNGTAWEGCWFGRTPSGTPWTSGVVEGGILWIYL